MPRTTPDSANLHIVYSPFYHYTLSLLSLGWIEDLVQFFVLIFEWFSNFDVIFDIQVSNDCISLLEC